MSSNQVISSTDKDFNNKLNMDYQINMIKRKVNAMAETNEPKKPKLEACNLSLDNTSDIIGYQQVIIGESEQDKFYEINSTGDNLKGDLDYELNGQTNLVTNGKSLNNNNLNAINLNNIKSKGILLDSELNQVVKESNLNLPSSPSHVVYLRNIPTDVTEAEILSFGLSFGKTVNCIILKGKNQAFLEFADLESAKSIVNYSILKQQAAESNESALNNTTATNPQLLTIRGRQIFAQYSNYQKLKTNDASTVSQLNNNQIKNNNHTTKTVEEEPINHNFNSSTTGLNLDNNQNLNVQNLLPNNPINQLNNPLNSLNSHNNQLNKNLLINNKTMAGANQQTQQNSIRNTNGNNGTASTQAQPSSVLRVIVDNMMYLVPLETFHDLFSRFGKVTKIVTFNKNGVFQALIQFENSTAAASAKSSYDGQQMFATGNLLRIDYSKLTNLSVKYNNEKSRDFTNSTLPAGPAPTMAANTVLSNVRNGSLTGVGSNPMSSLSTHLSPHQLAIAASVAQQHYQHLESVFSDPLGIAQISSFPGLTNSLPYATAGLRSTTLNSQTNGTHNTLGNVQANVNLSSVLLVSNLSEQMATPDALFTLFGVYGDVIRVKILFNKKDNALVQMSDPTKAQLVINYLDKINLFGNVLKISLSKYSNVQMPKDGQPDSGLTKDYTSSPLHRFKKPGSKNYQNIFPPSSTLHLSNIPSTCTEQKLRESFETAANVKVLNFKFFPNDQKMALIQLTSIEDAVSALIKMHNYQLSESNHLRVSFSKSSI